MVSFSASETSAALLRRFTLAALRTERVPSLGASLNSRSTLDRPGLQLQTNPQEESGPGREIFPEPNGFLSPGLKAKASICSKKLVYFLRTGRPPAPPGLIQPTLHILLL